LQRFQSLRIHDGEYKWRPNVFLRGLERLNVGVN
jgi:hypothetical protein